MNNGFRLIFIVLVSPLSFARGNKNYDDLLSSNELEVKKRISDVIQFFLPLPQDQFLELLKETASRYVPVNALSQECRNHSNRLLQDFLQGEFYALRMLDAGSKLVPGVLDGHLQDLGNYEQCVSVEEPSLMFRGQHCVINTAGLLPDTVAKADGLARNYGSSDVTFSICVPSSCSVEDVVAHVDLMLAPLNATTMYTRTKNMGLDPLVVNSHLTCSTIDTLSFRTKDYVALLFFVVIGVLVVGSSFYELNKGSDSVFSVFSVKSNLQSLLDTRAAVHEISCLNGLRVICITLVVMGHRLGFTITNMPTFRNTTLVEAVNSLIVRTIELCGFRAVDVFFLMGGTVLANSFFRERKCGLPFKFANFCLTRYLRLTPLLAVMMVFNSTLSVHMAQGPIWSRGPASVFEYPCVHYWWSGLLYIGNYYNPDLTCVGESWYMNCDFQLQVLAPLLLLPLYKKPRVGFLLTAACFLASVIGAGVNAYYKHLYSCYFYSFMTMDIETEVSSGLDYKGFHFRAPSFLTGILLGMLIFKAKESSFKISKQLTLLGWSVCVALFSGYAVISAALLSPQHQYSPWLDPLYVSLTKPVYCTCVAWLIFICAMGHGGLINKFLSWSLFRPLSRLTFGVYLVHELVIMLDVLFV